MLYQKLGIFGACLTLVSLLFGFVAFDTILKYVLGKQIALKEGHQVRSIYLKLPFPLDFCIYFFNVSNPMEVQTGATPILKEIGPYCYDEYAEKINVVDSDEEDSLTYNPYYILKFNQNKSGKLNDVDDSVTILHPLVIGMVNAIEKYYPAMLPVLNTGINLLFPDLKSIYLTATVRQILFDGIPINCRTTKFEAKAICTQLKSKIPNLKVTETQVYLFSVFGARNATPGKRIKVARGISNYKNVGKVLEVDSKREINIWKTLECNTFKGTDGWIYPPFTASEKVIWGYAADMCRSVDATYVADATLKGIYVRRYEFDLGDMEHSEKDKCYCDTPKTCSKKGVFDLSKCAGIPLYITLPHFLKTHEIYSKQVIGLNPVLEDHNIKMFLEPTTTVPIEGRLRIQFNFAITSNSKITLMKTVPTVLHPMFWIEESIHLEGEYLKLVKYFLLLIKSLKVIRWFGVITGVAFLSYGIYGYINETKGKTTQVHVIKSASGEDERKLDTKPNK